MTWIRPIFLDSFGDGPVSDNITMILHSIIHRLKMMKNQQLCFIFCSQMSESMTAGCCEVSKMENEYEQL